MRDLFAFEGEIIEAAAATTNPAVLLQVICGVFRREAEIGRRDGIPGREKLYREAARTTQKAAVKIGTLIAKG